MKALDLEGFIRELAVLGREVEHAAHEGVRKAAETIRDEAKSYIGHYQPQAGPFPAWEPLSEATLNGFVHPLAGHVPGKIEEGYAPPDNPLLRTGEMRDSIECQASGNEAVIGSNDEKAVWQEFGTPSAMFPIPPRSFLGRAAFVKGEEAARIIGVAVGEALAGSPLSGADKARDAA